MKTAPLLLATSLAANAALLAFVATRDSAKPPAPAKPSTPAATAPAPDPMGEPAAVQTHPEVVKAYIGGEAEA